jgi:zinc protease
MSRPDSLHSIIMPLSRIRRLTVALGFVGLTTLVTAPGVAAQRGDLEKIIQRRVLPNGLEVIVLESHGVPLATVEIDVRNGSFTQTPEYAGLAHLHEHMFFKANRAFPEPDEFIQRLSEVGAVFNASASEERVNYYMTVTADRLGDAVSLLSAALRTPLFRQDELERERVVVLGEYDRNESNPGFRLDRAVDEKLWTDAGSRKNTIGDRNIIGTTTPEKMREIQRRYYVPNNTALIVTGDVKPADVFALAERHLGSWERAPDPFVENPIPPIKPLTKNEAVIVEEAVGAVLVIMRWHGPSVGRDPGATYAADVFSDLVNQPGSGFHQRLIDSGLFQSLGVNYYTLNHVGPISIIGQTTPAMLKRALAALEAEIKRFSSPDYFTPAELEAVKAQRIVSSAFGRERASSFAQTIGFWWSVASLEYYMGYVDNMASQTATDLKSYADRYIVGKPRVTGVLISPQDRRAIGLTDAQLLGPRIVP